MGAVSKTLKALRDKLDKRGIVQDAQLTRYIVCRDYGTPNDRAAVIFRPPATAKQLRALTDTCKDVYGIAPPASLVELYKLTNGLWATSVGSSAAPSARGIDYEGGLRPIAAVLEALTDTGVEIEEADGEVYGDTMAVLPIVDVDVDWIALNPWRARDGEWPVVRYDHEDVDLDLPPQKLAKTLRVITKTFPDWLDRWIRAGFNVSLKPEKDYGEESPEIPEVSVPDAPAKPRPPFQGEIVDGRVVFVGPSLVLVRPDGQVANVKLEAEGVSVERNQHVRAGIEAGRVRFVEWTLPDGTIARADERWLGI